MPSGSIEAPRRARHLSARPPKRGDAEMAERIAAHRAPRATAGSLAHGRGAARARAGDRRRGARPDRPILVDCLTLWLSNLMLAGSRHRGRDRRPRRGACATPPGRSCWSPTRSGSGSCRTTPLGRALPRRRRAAQPGRRRARRPRRLRRGRPAAGAEGGAEPMQRRSPRRSSPAFSAPARPAWCAICSRMPTGGASRSSSTSSASSASTASCCSAAATPAAPRTTSSSSPMAASAAPSPTISCRPCTSCSTAPSRPTTSSSRPRASLCRKPLVQAFDWPEIRSRVTVDGVVDGDRRRRGRRRAASPTTPTAVARAARGRSRARSRQPARGGLRRPARLRRPRHPQQDRSARRRRRCADAARDDRGAAAPGGEARRARARPGSAGASLLGLGAAAEDDLAAPALAARARGRARPRRFRELRRRARPGRAIRRASCAGSARPIAAHDVLRVKGFLDVPGATGARSSRRSAAGSQHYFDRPWAPDETRASRLVVIGRKGLDRAAIAAAIEA